MTVTIGGETFAYDGYRVLEPEVTFDIHTKTAHDFVADFDTVYPVTRESYLLTSGADTETTVVKIVGQDPGPTLYVAAGIHGDERAAWYAGLMLQSITIKAGTLYVLAPANAWGAQRNQRRVGEDDPNRCFPGSETGTMAQRLQRPRAGGQHEPHRHRSAEDPRHHRGDLPGLPHGAPGIGSAEGGGLRPAL